jgi:16S rRNA (guanine966-N2)-methyltransferase
MRIIAGRFQRRALHAPSGRNTRPTADRTREAIFNLLQSRFHLNDAHVLDLFAGSGALGLEALSRGASSSTFVESDPGAVRTIHQNITSLGVVDETDVLRMDVLKYLLRPSRRFDLVFADPPYILGLLPTLPTQMLNVTEPEGYAVLEHDKRHTFEHHPGWVLSRPYGRTTVSLFEHPTQ